VASKSSFSSISFQKVVKVFYLGPVIQRQHQALTVLKALLQESLEQYPKSLYAGPESQSLPKAGHRRKQSHD